METTLTKITVVTRALSIVGTVLLILTKNATMVLTQMTQMVAQVNVNLLASVEMEKESLARAVMMKLKTCTAVRRTVQELEKAGFVLGEICPDLISVYILVIQMLGS